jgi:hypothetical protein
MTTFDKREQAFEAQFVHGEEVRFKAIARCNKLLGNWAAAKLGLTGEAAENYANGLVTAELEHRSGDDTLHKVARDLAPKAVSLQEVGSKMDEFLHLALEQLKQGK